MADQWPTDGLPMAYTMAYRFFHVFVRFPGGDQRRGKEFIIVYNIIIERDRPLRVGISSLGNSHTKTWKNL